MNLKLLFLIAASIFVFKSLAQETFPRNDVKDPRIRAYAFINATIYPDYQTRVDNATLLIKDGEVVNIGAGITIPDGYIIEDLEGSFIYPSLIDLYTNYGQPSVKLSGTSPFGSIREKITSTTPGPYNANEAIKSHYHAAENYQPDSEAAKSLREAGFGTVLTFRPDGLARGSSAFVSLDDNNANETVLHSRAAAHYSFSKGTSKQYFPVSPMGFIALLRQTYMDAAWYGNLNPKPFTDQSLDAWIQLQSLPQIFDTRDWRSLLRADRLGDEFGVQYIIKGSGDEYHRIREVKSTGASLIIPVNYPKAYEVEDPFDAVNVSLTDMKHWELAPTNPGVLEKNEINFAFTTDSLKNKKDFIPNLRKAVENGLSKETALKATTHNPADMIGMGNRIGSLEAGKMANFLITSGDLFDKETKIYENWIRGIKYIINEKDPSEVSGNYLLTIVNTDFNLEVKGKAGKEEFKIIVDDSTSIEVTAKMDRELITLRFKPAAENQYIALSGWKTGDKGWAGTGRLVDGQWIEWKAIYSSEIAQEAKSEKQESEKSKELGKVIYPFVAYGSEQIPRQQTILIKNATVWTNEPEGVLQNTDVLLQNGKISKIGKNINASDVRVIDGTGKHLTAGIIDEHSHIALDAVNDAAANSSMVRMKDVVNSESISIYQALSGGVTAAQLLHGSANPIGGQSAHIKLRWGKSPAELLINGSDEFIKFALGENVKRSSNPNSQRYPQSRMGVEQIYMDAFTAAADYKKEWDVYNSLSSRSRGTAIQPRRDLAMDAMVEVLEGKRFITCHSYVQSEINMLMKVAEKFNFRVNTFTHIMEGYKVADKMAAHGVGASTFSDWWAYKWEVRYAIPYNPTLMHNEGVVTAINSDNSEMMRRLNQEAAKSVKYGGMSEEDALKLVTLNPAKLLHWDDRMGSIKVGKDADVVLWSDHPLSIYAKAEQTIIDGTVYFDIERDKKLRQELAKERARLVTKMIEEKEPGSDSQPVASNPEKDFHCESIFGYDFELLED
ncbi:MAG: periplasmic amidohydrolase [Cyclobacteriaceae bacterium]|nr:MAG: periplasmic amidohydrolase [Cyclobacteriaceae bacterium]